MAPSESDPSLDELCSRLAEAKPRDEPGVMARIWRVYLDDPDEWKLDPSQQSVEILRSYLDHDDPELRSGAAFVLSTVAAGKMLEPEPEDLVDTTSLTAQLLERIDDDSPRVRQVILSTGIHGGIVDELLDDSFPPAPSAEDDLPKSVSWLAMALFDHLDDPVPVVRKRVAGHLRAHAVELVERHPEPDAAVGSLVDALGDDLDALAPNRDAATPRSVAARSLREVAAESPALLVDHVDRLVAYLDVEDTRVRPKIAAALGDLIESGHVTDPETAERVVDCLATEGRNPELLASAALAAGDRAERPERALLLTLQGARPDARGTRADALARYVRESERSHEPPYEALSEYAESRPFADREADPMVVLAPEHPAFVADWLTDWHESILDGDTYGTIDDDLLVDVWEANPAVLEAFLEYAAETAGPAFDYERRGRHEVSPSVQTVHALADRRPELVADVIPDVLAARGRSVSLNPQVANLVEAVAGIGPPVTEATVAALAATLRSHTGNLEAARALAALSEVEHDAVDEQYEVFVDPYRAGDLDGSSSGGKYALPPVAAADPAFVTAVLYDILGHWAAVGDDADGEPNRTLAAVADAELAAVEPILDDLLAVTLSGDPADDRIERLSDDQLFALVKFYISEDPPNGAAFFRRYLDALVPVVAHGSAIDTAPEEVTGPTTIPGRFDAADIVELIDSETTLTPETVEPELARFVDRALEWLLSPSPSAMDLHTDIANQIGFGTPAVFEPHAERLLDAATAADTREEADLVGYVLCELGAETPDTVAAHLDSLLDLVTDADIATRSVAVGTLGKLLAERPERAATVAEPLGTALPDVYTWARSQAVKALEAAAQADPTAVQGVAADLVALLVEFEGVPDGADFTTRHESRRAAKYAITVLERLAAADPEPVQAAFERHGSIESVSVPGQSDRLAELQAALQN